MSYLLIVLILLIAAAPLVWVKSSARQDKIAVFRHLARNKGVDVVLCHAPDARKGDGSLDHVQYLLRWLVNEDRAHAPELLLVRKSRRGDPTHWADWRWLRRPKNKMLDKRLGEILPGFSEDVVGLTISKAGVGFFWQERGTTEDFEANIRALETLQKGLKESL